MSASLTLGLCHALRQIQKMGVVCLAPRALAGNTDLHCTYRYLVHTCTIYRDGAPPPALECPGECSANAQVVQSCSEKSALLQSERIQ